MSYRTLEVELEDGRVWPHGLETLPVRSLALLTLLESHAASPILTCGELAERWSRLEKLPSEEANAFAADLESARAKLPALKPAWD